MQDVYGNKIVTGLPGVNKLKGTKKEKAPIPEIADELLSSTYIVIPIYNSLRTVDPLVRSLKERTSPLVHYIIVNDASDRCTRDYLADVDLPNCTVLRNTQNLKYTKTINKGVNAAAKAGAKYIVTLNSDTMVTDGWLERMIQAATSAPKVGIVCPYMSNAALLTLDMPNGANYLEVADRVAVASEKNYPNAVTPVGACMLLDADCWNQLGPFDDEESPEGYGEECFFWVKALRAGWKALIADDSYLYHESHASYGRTANRREKEAVDNFLSKHGVFFSAKRLQAQQKDRKPALVQSIGQFSTVNDKPNICFYITSIQLCGGILALVNICNELNEMGVNATIAYERDFNNEWQMMPTRFKPIVLSDKTNNWLRDGGFKEGHIVGTAWFTGDFVSDLCNKHPGLKPMAFIQDREDQFRLPNGSMQYDNHKEIATYLAIARRKSVVNSNWVHDSLVKDYKFKAERMAYIPIGVDPYLFYPRYNRETQNPDNVRILSFCRLSTPRRGYATLCTMIEKLYNEYGNKVNVYVYGENPNPNLPCKGLGKLSQAHLAIEMAKSDILIEPSFVQGWGMPGQEMMSTGGCLVSTDNGGIHNYGVHNKNCLIGGSSADDMYRQLQLAIENPALRRRLGAQGRKDMFAFHWRNIAESWKEALLR